MDSNKSLTRRQFDEVMRRATELAAAESDGEERGFSDSEVMRIAQEVGLGERYVRRALTEVRSGHFGQVTQSGAFGLKPLLGKGTIWAARVVPRSRREVARELDEFMVAGQLLQPVRRSKNLLQYRPAVDWASRVARAASSASKQYYVAAARLVEVRLEEDGPGSTHVEVHVDPGILGDYQAGAFFGGGSAGIGLGVGAGFLAAAVAPLAIAIACGAVVGLACGLGVGATVGRAFDRRLGQVQSEVEGILDRLESGEMLEPPPPSWRRWVRRHFHGVAREILGTDDL